MADDLDAFFDEVSAAEEEAKLESKDEGLNGTNSGKNAGEALETAAQEESKEPAEERPAKRPKVVSAGGTIVASKPAMVVAAAQPTVSVPKADAGESVVTTISPTGPAPPPLPKGPPPPPPPRQPGVSIGPQVVPTFQSTLAGPSVGPIGPSAIPPPPPPPPPPPGALGQQQGQGQAPKSYKRSAAGQSWEDQTLAEFPENDFRLFVGNLAKDIREDQLADAFRSRYPSYAMSRICRNKDDGKSRGYGFVSLMDPKDMARALREMDQTWLGSRPIKVRKSEWKDRDLKEVRKKNRHEKRRNKRHLY